MKSPFARGSALVLVLLLASAPARAHDMSFTQNVKGDQDVITCSDVEMMFWTGSLKHSDIVTVRRDQSVAVSAPRSGPLHLVASHSGGVWVQASSNGSISATVCMAAGAESQSAGNAILDQLRIVNEGGELRVKGPENEDWSAYVIVSVPKGTSVDMEADNGALDVRAVSGTFTMRTENGPIAIVNAGGKVIARAANGPIDFKGHEGNMDLKADNGPVTVKLTGPTWSGRGLEASTANGPITVVTPEGLQTGVRVEGSENSPFSWKVQGAAKKNASMDWDNGHAIVLGNGPVLVHVSTVNGPVSVKTAGATTSSPSSKGKSRI